MSLARLVGPIHPIGIELAGTDPFYPNVPYVAGAVARCIQFDGAGRRAVFGMVEELQSNAPCVTAEDGKIDSASRLLGSGGQRRAGPYVRVFGDLRNVTMQFA